VWWFYLYANLHAKFIMLSVIMLNVVYAEGHRFICRLSDVMLNGIMLSVVMQNVVYVYAECCSRCVSHFY
jgi:hypothetical protein